MQIAAFPQSVTTALSYYVYRLIDPRNGETFYIGKGKGNRVFAHALAASDLDGDVTDNKLQRIREIQLAGLAVGHVIHRHGMDETTSLEVEAALIDAYPGLTNLQNGHGSNDNGVMHVTEIISRYEAKPAVFAHKALLINIHKSATDTSLYDATRFAWRISRERAMEAEVILATRRGMILGAFVADNWIDATADNFPGLPTLPGRLGFIGREAAQEVAKLYVGKQVPHFLRKRGASNPIRYSWLAQEG